MARASLKATTRTRKDGNAKGVAVRKVKTVAEEPKQDKQTVKKQGPRAKNLKAGKK